MIRKVYNSVQKRGLRGTAALAWKLLTLPHPSFVRQAQELIRDKSGCEIGGPSFDFTTRGAIPLYRHAARVDNFQYSSKTRRTDFIDGAPFQFHSRKPAGTTHIREGTDLRVPDGHYDFVLSSHMLEHCANPLKALKEWHRVAKPRSTFIILVPYQKWWFDHRRQVTPIQHILDDYTNGTGEDDMTHFEEIVALTHRPVFSPEDEPLETYFASCRDNVHTRQIHHHVFDPDNLRELLRASGLVPIAIECVKPCHIISLSTRLG